MILPLFGRFAKSLSPKMCAVPKYSLAEQNRTEQSICSKYHSRLGSQKTAPKIPALRKSPECLENSDLIEFLVGYQSLADSGVIGGEPLRSDSWLV